MARGVKAQRRKTEESRPDTAPHGRDPLATTCIEADVLYTYSRQNIPGCELVIEEARIVFIFQYHNIVNICLSALYILEFLYFNSTSEGEQYLDWCVCGLVFVCSSRLPENGTPVPKHVDFDN